ncbi:MAG: hypothetical protein LBQ79_02845 [Deltaproteobacteria bacterium]|jgi:hypothetical protein|nr:hypothetical protein [Deltaproteobacteria bacterium]
MAVAVRIVMDFAFAFAESKSGRRFHVKISGEDSRRIFQKRGGIGGQLFIRVYGTERMKSDAVNLKADGNCRPDSPSGAENLSV